MSDPRSVVWLYLAAGAQGLGSLYLLLMGLMAGELSGTASVVLLAMALDAAVGAFFLFYRRRWAWYLSLAVAALMTAMGLTFSFLNDVFWIGLIHAAAGASILGALWAGRNALAGTPPAS